MKKALFTLVAVTLFVSSAYGQLTPSSSVVTTKIIQPQKSYLPGSSAQILMELDFTEGWHSQSHTPSQDSLIPTVLKFLAPDGITTGKVFYPEGKMVKFSFSDILLSSYEGKVYIGASLTFSPELAPGEYMVKAILTIQSCNDKACLMPSDIEIPIPVTVAPKGSVVEKINEDIFSSNESLFSSKSGSAATSSWMDGNIGDYLMENGLFFTYFLIFLGGLALNLTPCVYPLIPITISYFGGKSESKKGNLLVHSLMYLLGMATMYSALGLMAALTGGLFGAILQSPVMIILIAGILTALALSMFGLYEIRVPASLAAIGGKNREGIFGTFMMGLTVGIIAAPCIGPFVLGLLTFVGERQDPLLGFTMFFTLAIGLGLPLVFLALFSGSVSKIPRSGLWMVWVKQVFGIILLAMALYFLEPLIPDTWYAIMFAIFMAGSALYLTFLTKIKATTTVFKLVKAGVGALFIAIAILAGWSVIAPEGPKIEWIGGSDTTVDAALKSSRPVVIDFTAEWCVPCKELDHFTFSDERVVAMAKNFKMIKVDLTKTGDPKANAVKDRFAIVGVPTVLLFDKNGVLRDDLTFSGFIDADEFLKKMTALAPSGE